MSGTPRILAKSVNWLGDVVMTLPALRALRRGFPNAHLAVLVRKELASFFDGTTWIDDVIPYGIARGVEGVADRARIIGKIRAERFDLAVLFPRSFEAAFWAALGRIPRRVGFSTQGRGALLTRRVPFGQELKAAHQANDYLYLLREGLGITGDVADCLLTAHAPLQAAMQEWLRNHRHHTGPLIALAPGAAYGPAKQWPIERYAALIDTLSERHGAECVLIGAPSERALCEQIATAARARSIVAAGQTSIGEGIAMLSLCQGFAGNDSGSMHVAGVLGIPTVGIFGSTNPHRTGPLGPHTAILYDKLDCSPCLERTCRFGHYDCLKRIEVESVRASLERLGSFSKTHG